MRYCDPHVLDKFPAPCLDYDPDAKPSDPKGYLILSGGPMTPQTQWDAAHGLASCPSCGCKADERLYRRRSAWNARKGEYGPQAGRVMCLGCDKGSLDDLNLYPGWPVGSRIDPDYPVDQPAYVPDAELAGGKGEVKATRKVKRAAARAKERAGS